MAAQQTDDARVAALVAAARHMDAVVERVGVPAVAPRDLRLDPGGADPALVQQLGRALDVRIAPMEEVLECDASKRCRSTDGSRAGIRILEAELGPSSATVVLSTWVLWGEGRIYLQVDRLSLSRTSSGWTITRVERLSET